MNELAEQIFRESLVRQSPSAVLNDIVFEDTVKMGEVMLDLDRYPSVHVAGSGKAAWQMVRALRDTLGDRMQHALAISSFEPDASHPDIELHKAAHPVPDATSFRAGEKLIHFVEEVPENSLLLYAISGGTSSLVCGAAGQISIDDLNVTFDLLNNSGATIREINTVRKHLSRIKGGQLLRHLNPSVTLVDLVISDVPGDDLEIIGSGPTTPDSSTYQDAYHILLKYNLWEQLPGSVQQHIEQGIDGIAMETVKPGEDPVTNHHSWIVGSAAKLAHQAGELLQEQGYNTWIAEEAYNKDVAEVATMIADKAIAVNEQRSSLSLPAALVFYGESTVDVTGQGKGGRNQELALRAALNIQGCENITWLSAGTDGIDGPTDAAGAVVDGQTITQARNNAIDPLNYLRDNNTYHFHQECGTLLKTGHTGNNLMDLQIVLVE